VLAGWMYHVGRSTSCRAAAVKVARNLTHNAVKAAWRTPTTLR